MSTVILPAGPIIAAFDVATACGCCDGRPGGRARVWTWHLSDGGNSRPLRLGYMRRLLDAYFAEGKPDQIFYEAPMPLGAIMSAKPKSGFVVSDEQLSFLRGAIGVLESCAGNAEIPIQALSPQDARQHLTGQRTYPKAAKGQKSAAKQAVMQVAATLGVVCENDNESDAFAIWSLGCAMANPRTAHLNTELFRQRG